MKGLKCRGVRSLARFIAAAVVVQLTVVGPGSTALMAGDAATSSDSQTNSFPDPATILAGKAFTNTFDREVYFLKSVCESYPSQWAPLLKANLLVTDYVVDPGKLQRFVQEVGKATAGTDDLVAATNLAVIVSDAAFYANTNAFRPEILGTTAKTLIEIGPNGRRALAAAFNEGHYRVSPESLEVLAQAVELSGSTDPKLLAVLAATAFSFSASNGGNYPSCTRTAVVALLHLPGGIEAVRHHLNEKEIFDDPVRFQDVVESIISAKASGLQPDLIRLENATKARLELLKASASSASAAPYLEELEKLRARLDRATSILKSSQTPEAATVQ